MKRLYTYHIIGITNPIWLKLTDNTIKRLVYTINLQINKWWFKSSIFFTKTEIFLSLYKYDGTDLHSSNY